MCGIAAVFNMSKENRTIPKIKEMTDIIRHRGPDDEGFALFGSKSMMCEFYGGPDTPHGCYTSNFRYAPQRRFSGIVDTHYLVALGHRRLSILDLSPGGHQPMSTEDGRYTITYNGEIYNYLELRKELEDLGYRFVSHSDTEVILNAYRCWGKSCLNRFNGMFAFVLYDCLERKLFAARDRFGVKPLYYWYSPCGFLAFASEVKQFTVLPGWRAVLNGQRAYDFLCWGIADHSSDILFSGVSQFQGGEYVECNVNDIERRLPIGRWYHLAAQNFEGSLNDATDIFKNLFSDSIKLRLRADVPIGTGLSGGLDSSSIVCLVNNLLHERDSRALQKTFSACTTIKSFDEREFIDEVVRHTGVSAHYTYPSVDDLRDTLQLLIWHHDEPFFSTSVYAEWCVFKLAAQTGVKVTLDGHGSDELLAGYHCFFSTYFAGLFSSFRWRKLYEEIRSVKKIHGYSALYSIQRILGILLPEIIRRPLKKMLGASSTSPCWIDMQLVNAKAVDPLLQYNSRTSSMQQLSYSQTLHTSLPVQLHWADRDSMAHSIEARAPFLDYRIVEFLLGLPDSFKITGGVTKRILRQAAGDILPAKIRMRMDKMGFVTPEEVWMRQHQPDWFRRAVNDAIGQSRGILKPNVMMKADRIISGKDPFDFFIWRIICFGKWMERFSVNI